LAVENLPLLHRDPFDRLLVAQALTEHMCILSQDKMFEPYGVKQIW
jgi:PIN domain nuclease of toxin-antitoxin system